MRSYALVLFDQGGVYIRMIESIRLIESIRMIESITVIESAPRDVNAVLFTHVLKGRLMYFMITDNLRMVTRQHLSAAKAGRDSFSNLLRIQKLDLHKILNTFCSRLLFRPKH
jgi:hypothetical protein